MTVWAKMILLVVNGRLLAASIAKNPINSCWLEIGTIRELAASNWVT
jgi:hypothetical protein